MGVHRNDPVGNSSPSPIGNESVEMLEEHEDLITFLWVLENLVG